MKKLLLLLTVSFLFIGCGSSKHIYSFETKTNSIQEHMKKGREICNKKMNWENKKGITKTVKYFKVKGSSKSFVECIEEEPTF